MRNRGLGVGNLGDVAFEINIVIGKKCVFSPLLQGVSYDNRLAMKFSALICITLSI